MSQARGSFSELALLAVCALFVAAACAPSRHGAAQASEPRAAAEVKAASEAAPAKEGAAPEERAKGAAAEERAKGVELTKGGEAVRALEPCVPLSYEICFNALDDNCNGALEEGCGTPAGVVQFMIAWEATRADVDLNVTDPNGELIEAGRVTQSGLLKGRDCPGRRQECAGVNLENVFLEGNKPPTRGTYRVSVALESLAGDEPPIWVNLSSRLGAKHYAFEIRLDEPEDERHLELSL